MAINWFNKAEKKLDDALNQIEITPFNPLEKSMAIGKIENVDENKTTTDEWVWVEGYKATERDMTCRDYQYEMNKQHDMPDGKDIKECSSGFHICLSLEHVFGYYPIGRGHRYFRVRALVRKKDLDNYGKKKQSDSIQLVFYSVALGDNINDKLAAKSIVFTEELTIDEIFASSEYKDFTDEEKKLAIDVSPNYVIKQRKIVELVEAGYSEPFAMLIRESKKVDRALALATQPGLSMDMKAWLIFKN